jgi:hypothetical protein
MGLVKQKGVRLSEHEMMREIETVRDSGSRLVTASEQVNQLPIYEDHD